jgi:hypothetical protein
VNTAPPRGAPKDLALLRCPIGPGPPQPGSVLCCFSRSVPQASRARPARLVEPPIGLVWVVILATHGLCRSGWCLTRGVAGQYGTGLSESCGWPGGRGAPRLGFGGHGAPTATQGGATAVARGVRGRPGPHFNGTGPAVTGRASPDGNRGRPCRE